MNNHQIVWNLAIRLVLYSVTFLFITVKDLWIYRPPLTSDMWLAVLHCRDGGLFPHRLFGGFPAPLSQEPRPYRQT
jgi:hypothetical protein